MINYKFVLTNLRPESPKQRVVITDSTSEPIIAGKRSRLKTLTNGKKNLLKKDTNVLKGNRKPIAVHRLADVKGK